MVGWGDATGPGMTSLLALRNELAWPPETHDRAVRHGIDRWLDFWLHLADGGSVYFDGGPGGYQAKQVFDPHGLRTDLPIINHQRATSTLSHRKAGGGLALAGVANQGWGEEVITAVTSGRPERRRRSRGI